VAWGGYTPRELTSISLSYSYDEGGTWTAAEMSKDQNGWTAEVNHADASGAQVWLRTEITDAAGNRVEQLVARAYDVR
jgi:hypothetical protein